MDTSFVALIHNQETQQDGGHFSQLQAGQNWEREDPSLRKLDTCVPYRQLTVFLDLSFLQSLEARRKPVS